MIFSSSSHNFIHVHTEKQQYYSGDVVRGNISLSISTPTHVDGVYIKIKGYEEAKFEEEIRIETVDKDDNTKNKVEYKKIIRSEFQVFFRRKYCVHSYKCTLSNGNFLFPFEFQLDHGLPGTFNYKNHSAYGSVKFKVKAEVLVPGFFKANIKNSQDILICQSLDRVIMSSDTFKESNVTFLCCIPKGKLSMAANIDQNAYGPGGIVNVRLIIDNSLSKVNLEGCNLKLIQSIDLHAEGKNAQFSTCIAKTKTPQITRGEQVDRIIQLMIPTNAEPSTKGRLVKCEYSLVIEMVVPWSPNIRLYQPVQVFAPVQQSYLLAPTLPPNWDPQVMPKVDLNTLQYQSY